MKDIYLDTETIGLPEEFEGDILCQLAYVVREYHKYTDSINVYFAPEQYKDMKIEAMARTNLTPEFLEKNHSNSKREAILTNLQTILLEPDNILWIHNAEFDLEVLKRAGLKVHCKVICTMRVMKFINDKTELQFKSIALEYLYYHSKSYLKFEDRVQEIGLDVEDMKHAHDALYDVIALELVIEWMATSFKLDINGCIQITNNPILLTYCSFGKNRGMMWKDMTYGQLKYFYELNDKDICYTIDSL